MDMPMHLLPYQADPLKILGLNGTFDCFTCDFNQFTQYELDDANPESVTSV